MMPFSCLNGWACGNIAAAPVDLASFYYHLLNGKGDLLRPDLATEMSKTSALTTGWSTGLPYGFGISIATNSATGMNCGLSDISDNFHAGGDAQCQLYKATMEAIGEFEGREVPEIECGSHDLSSLSHFSRVQTQLSDMAAAANGAPVKCPWSVPQSQPVVELRDETAKPIYV
jgi:hypothetical protein